MRPSAGGLDAIIEGGRRQPWRDIRGGVGTVFGRDVEGRIRAHSGVTAAASAALQRAGHIQFRAVIERDERESQASVATRPVCVPDSFQRAPADQDRQRQRLETDTSLLWDERLGRVMGTAGDAESDESGNDDRPSVDGASGRIRQLRLNGHLPAVANFSGLYCKTRAGN